jgi:hypothetical protein
MGSAKFRSDGRELVRERRLARMRRNEERREARDLKRAQSATTPPVLSAAQRLAEDEVAAAVDGIVAGALERHDRRATNAIGDAIGDVPAEVTEAGTVAVPPAAPRAQAIEEVPPQPACREPRVSSRDRDIAQFRERRQTTASEARREARARIARQGEPAAVADALAAIWEASGDPWRREREQLEHALSCGQVAEVGAVARRALWAVSRDAARTSRRLGRDSEIAAAVCVCYAVIAQLPRTTVRSRQRTTPTAHARARAFWR